MFDKPINALAEWLSKPTGFILLNGICIAGIAAQHLGYLDNGSFTLFLSILAIILTSLLLPSQRRFELSLQLKLDELVAASRADNTAIGAEHRDIAAIESEVQAVENRAGVE